MTFTGVRAKLRICDYIRVFFHPLEACLIWWYQEIRMNVNGITNVNVTVSPCIFYIDLICTNVCTCIYEYNITYAVTLVTLFAPTCFDHT